METKNYDLLILGGGNAIALAIRAGKAGKRVAVVEKDRLGGTCPNRGCIPSKLLLGYAEVANRIRESGRFHITSELQGIDGDAILRDTRAATIDSTDGNLEKALPDGVDLYRGHGRFTGDRTVAVDGATLRGETVVVATGTRPRKLPQFDEVGIPYWTSDDVFTLEKLPASITVVGGGYIACELAHFFDAIGVETTVVYRGDQLLKNMDRDVRAAFQVGFTQRVTTVLDAQIAEPRHDGNSFSMQLVTKDGSTREHESEALLYAIGRVPNTDDIGLEAGGIETDRRGFIVIDDRMRTSAEGVHALGDVKGRHLFTHAAAYEANYLGDRFLDGEDEPLDYGPMPSAVFTSPELASVGATQEELEDGGVAHVTAQVPFRSAAKGRAVKEEHGLCKFLLSPGGEILGCHIVGHEASVLLHEVIPVMKWRNHISSLTRIIHVHPSLAEVVRNAARKAEAALSS